MSARSAADRRIARRERKARYRARVRNGLCVVPVEVGKSAIDGLVQLGLLRDRDADDAQAIGASIEALLDSLE